MLRQRRIESNSPARICPIPKPIAKPITNAFRSDRISRPLSFAKTTHAILYPPCARELSGPAADCGLTLLYDCVQSSISNLLTPSRCSPLHAIRHNLRSRRCARRLRALVEPDRREITGRLRRDVSRRISPERGWGELPDRGRVLQEGVWPLRAH